VDAVVAGEPHGRVFDGDLLLVKAKAESAGWHVIAVVPSCGAPNAAAPRRATAAPERSHTVAAADNMACMCCRAYGGGCDRTA
jgi:hypothetical protein